MLPIEIGIFDTSFVHHPRSTVPSASPEFITWNRISPEDSPLVCFSNEQILSPKVSTIPFEKRIALLYESKDTMKWLYKEASKEVNSFKYFFTHDSKLLSKYKNSHWIPGNGVWIGTKYGGGQIGIAPKDRTCSFLTSDKNTTVLHKQRMKLAKQLIENDNLDIDVYLRKAFPHEYLPINIFLSRYKFSIIIENSISPVYFTEKILNCMAVGTIPIYLGASKIGDFFDERGIIQFNSRRHLINKILPKLNDSLYMSKIKYARENLSRLSSFLSIEQAIFKVVSQNLA